jgi:formylglycine-generating enzyme required for sulfatase activity/tRNA A-37 threonylcarbamoyl transferase component Bud32/dienelactone hydrolase
MEHERDGLLVGATSIGPGTKLGPYEIEAQLGAGGMGRVFRARDSRLGRTVAIKISLAQFTGRFEREARAIAAMNHPHICTLHDVGPNYLVMELVEGETLGDALKRGPLPLDQALRYAAQIAGALAAAHAQGIVHRDLKPGNVMITAAGVKVLDFGLAKHAIVANSDTETDTVSLTSLEAQTRPGHIVGTVAYMSPEQVESRPLDARSDVFAFGVVLYEMLSGHRPFHGESTIATLAAILQTTPEPLRQRRHEIPDAVEQIVRRCLEKKPEARYRSASEIQQALTALSASSSSATFAVPRFALLAAGLLILAAIGVYAWQSRQRAERMRWAEEIAVPEIARLIQANRGLAARKLFEQAEQYSPSSRLLFRIAEGVATRPVAFETTPAGAEIYISDYTAGAGDDPSEWVLVGEAPLSVDTIPNWGYYRARAVKAGFTPADAVFGGTSTVPMTLHAEGTVPAGMVWVPAIGATPTAPVLALPAYWLDRFEVTNREFKKFVDAGGYRKPEYWKHLFVKDGRVVSHEQATAEFRDLTGRPGPATWQLGAFPEGTADLPVGGVSWFEAMAYAEFAGKSLPTVYEWQRAAGVGVNSDILQLSNFSGKPAPVGTHRGMTPFGSFDMAGNVKEWTTNASGDARYILGGASDEPAYAFAMPDARSPFARESTFGFRCVRRPTAPPDESFAPLTLSTARAITTAPASDETYRVFVNLHAYTKSDLEARIERVDGSSPYWRRETVTFRAAYGNERVIAHLFLPMDTPPPYQIVAIMGGSTITDAIRRIEDYDYPFEFIVRSGRAVVIPAYSGTLERGPTPYRLPENQLRERGLRWSMDLGRTIDYLETRSDIDTRKLGFYGLSSGAIHGIRLLAVDARFKAAVLASAGLPQNQPPETDSWNFAPRFRVPVLMVNGRHDFLFPLETNQKPLFEALGAREPHKKHILYDGGHRNLVTRPDMIGEVLNWFDRYLGSVDPVRAKMGTSEVHLLLAAASTASR